jgi:transcriptional regulator of met regulon
MAGELKFYVGLHRVNHAHYFGKSMISVNRLRSRKSDFAVDEWILDSGAFTQISTHGRFLDSVKEYAGHIRRWASVGNLVCAVAQDFMCEPFIVAKTGLSVERHQGLTVERYDALMEEDTGVPILPVIQGYRPEEYRSHVRQYGDRLTPGMWVGVGSICKRNSRPREVHHVLSAIYQERSDLRLHGFGLKITALRDPEIVAMLHSADSMAWSFAARRAGRDANDWREAKAFVTAVGTPKRADQIQGSMIF